MLGNDSLKKRRKRASKNKKKSWSKYCDIKDVEEFLDHERVQATGAFKIHNEEKVNSRKRKREQEPVLPANEKKDAHIKRAKYYGSLNVDKGRESLAVPKKEPLVKGSKKHERRSKMETRKLSRLKQIQADIQKMDVVRKCRVRQKEIRKRRAHVVDTSHFYNLWPEPDMAPPMIDEEFIEKVKPVKPPNSYFMRPSRLSAIETPHPGTSYNPSYKDHQDLLQNALTAAKAQSKAAKKLGSAPEMKRESWQIMDTDVMGEMTSGLFEEKAGKNVKPKQTVDDMASFISKIIGRDPLVKPRTMAARKREKLEKTKVTRLKKLKQKKKLQNDVFRLKSIKAEIEQEHDDNRTKLRRRHATRTKMLDRTRKLGPNKFVAPDLDYKLTQELVGSYRSFVPEGNLLRDQFKSLQKRNLLRATVEHEAKEQLKFRQPKLVQRRRHREITLT